jgi:hypothetical protein
MLTPPWISCVGTIDDPPELLAPLTPLLPPLPELEPALPPGAVSLGVDELQPEPSDATGTSTRASRNALGNFTGLFMGNWNRKCGEWRKTAEPVAANVAHKRRSCVVDYFFGVEMTRATSALRYGDSTHASSIELRSGVVGGGSDFGLHRSGQ